MTTTRPAWAYTLPAALLLMAPFDILASLAMDIYLPVVPAMPGILNTTPAMIQLTLSLYMVMLGVGRVIFGPLSDRIGRRPILLAGATAFVIASLGAAWSSTAPAFVAFRLLQAVGASAMLVATFATVRDVYANRPEGVVIYGLFQFGAGVRACARPYRRSMDRRVLGMAGDIHYFGYTGDARTPKCGFQVARNPPSGSSQDAPICLADLRESGFLGLHCRL
nr:Multidrug resistance protein MdtL [Escherichia coli]